MRKAVVLAGALFWGSAAGSAAAEEGRGAGLAIQDFSTRQLSYGPVRVRFRWTETRPVTRLTLVRNGVPTDELRPLPPSAVPGVNEAEVQFRVVFGGNHTYALQVDGVVQAEAEQSVVTARPPNPAGNLACASAGDLCGISASWESTEPGVIDWSLSLNGDPPLELDAAATSVDLSTLRDGGNCVELVAGIDGRLVQDPENPRLPARGEFATAPVESCCEIPCLVTSISGLSTRQIGYLNQHGTNRVRIWWTETEPTSGPVRVFMEGVDEPVATVEGGGSEEPVRNEVEIQDVPAGDQTFTVEVGDVPSDAQTVQTVDDDSRVGDVASLRCECEDTGDDEECEIIVCWGPVEPVPGNYDLFLDETLLETTAAQGSEGSARFAVTDTDIYCVTVEAYIEGSEVGAEGSFGSPPAEVCCEVSCGSVFVRGSCNGESGDPTISSAVFGLLYLFAGGAEPPCLEACNFDGDDELNMTDMIGLLGFLFRGEGPPSGWVDSDGDGAVEQTCEVAPVADCQTSQSSCSV